MPLPKAFKFCLGLVVLGLAYWLLLGSHLPSRKGSTSRPSTALIEISNTKPSPGTSSSAMAVKPKHTSPLAMRLNATDGNAQEDVETLVGLMGQYFSSMQNRQGWPLGSSRDLARVLTGDNPLHLTVIASDHPAINTRGYLVDRWGTPYHLHQLSSRVIDVRSAGPDRALFTEDDVVNESASAHQP